MSKPSALCLRFTRLHDGFVVGTASRDSVFRGLTEDVAYSIELRFRNGTGLFIDDVEVQRSVGGHFLWTPSLYSGNVHIAVSVPDEGEVAFTAEVGAAPHKALEPQFNQMLDAIRQFDAAMLTGTSSARLAFGSEGIPGRFDGLVLLARLRKYGPLFVNALRMIARTPHESLALISESVPLSRIRRLPAAALRSAELVRFLAIDHQVDDAIDSIRLDAQSFIATPDTPANRAMKSLLMRFRSKVSSLADLIATGKLCGSHEDQAARRPRRLQLLRSLIDATTKILTTYPFSHVTTSVTTAAAFAQIAAHPTYRLAYRSGMSAMRLGVESTSALDLLNVTPSWGIYETWCFIKVKETIEQITGLRLEPVNSTLAAAELAMRGTFDDGLTIDLCFQALFPAGGAAGRRSAWSVSRERRPDMIVVLGGEAGRFIVLDAKYRAGRTAVLDSMASAHIYHDSLRMGQIRPELCLLLTPGMTELPALEEPSFLQRHGVGALSRFIAEGAGMLQCRRILENWMHAGENRPLHIAT